MVIPPIPGAGAGLYIDADGNLAIKTSGTIGVDATGHVFIPAGSVQAANLAPGSLGDLSNYSSSVRAIAIVFGLPTLPNTNYPQGSIVMNLGDGKVYRNTTGTAWSVGVAPQDILAGTLGAGVVYAGTVNAAQINVGTLTGFTLNGAFIYGSSILGSTLHLDNAGFVTDVNNVAYSGSVPSNVGVRIWTISNSAECRLHQRGLYGMNNSGVVTMNLGSGATDGSVFFSSGDGSRFVWWDGGSEFQVSGMRIEGLGGVATSGDYSSGALLQMWHAGSPGHPPGTIYYFWVDSSGRLRIKNAVPSSDTDGTIVGTQS